MIILFWNSMFFFFALFIHFAVWRIHLPRRHIDALFKIFIAVLACGLFVFNIKPGISLFGIAAPENVSDSLRLCLFYLATISAYLISYSAIEADSPSLVFTLKIALAGKKGLNKKLLETTIKEEELILPRMDDLVRDGLAVSEKDIYRLTRKGRYFVNIFILFRNLLGLPKGG